jgi:heptosyltransferase-2
MPRVHPSQILVVRLGAIGDVLLATPLVRALRRAVPGARLAFLTKGEHAGLLRGNPHVDEVLAWPERAPGPAARRGPAAAARSDPDPRRAAPWSREARVLAAELRARGPLWLVDLQASPRTLAFAPLLRPRRRFVWRKPYLRRQLLVSFRIDRYPATARSVAERYFDAVRPLGLRPDGGGLDLEPGEDAERAAAEVLGRAGRELGVGRWVAVAPGARWATKRWPPESFAAAARELARGGPAGPAVSPDAGSDAGPTRGGHAAGPTAGDGESAGPNGSPGRGVVVLGSAEDRAAAGVVSRLLREAGTPVLDLAGRLPLLASAAALARCDVVLTNDSGLMHVAAALGVPAVALFGSTAPQLGFAPYRSPARVLGVEGLPCRPCTHVGRPACPLGHFRCMRGIVPAAAAGAGRELLAESVRPGAGGGAAP